MAHRCACPTLKSLLHKTHILPCLCLCAGFAVNAVSQTSPPEPIPVPDGTMFTASVKKALRAEKLNPGDTVEFNSTSATLIGKQTVVPANAVFHGHVVAAEAADSNAERVSRLSVVVDSVTWKKRTVPMCATIAAFGSREFRTEQDAAPQSPLGAPTWKPQSSKMHSTLMEGSENPVESMSSLIKEETTVPKPDLVISWDMFVGDIQMYGAPNALTVLTRKKKNIKLPGGLLVGLREIPVTNGICAGTNSTK